MNTLQGVHVPGVDFLISEMSKSRENFALVL